MFKIDIQEAIDYCKCPMYYFFKYKHPEIKTDYVNTVEKYDKDIHKVLYYSFSRAQEGLGIRIEDIKAAWGRAWVKDKRKSHIMFTDTLSNKDTYNERRKKGLDSLLNFHKNFSKNPGFPVLINKKYSIDITKNLKLTGDFEVVRELKDDMGNPFIEVDIFKTDEHSNNRVNKEYDMKLTAAALAAKEYISYHDIRYMLYHVDKKNKIYHTDQTIHTDIFKKSILNIFKAIHNNIYYMAPDEKCFHCIYKDVCADQENVFKILDKEENKC